MIEILRGASARAGGSTWDSSLGKPNLPILRHDSRATGAFPPPSPPPPHSSKSSRAPLPPFFREIFRKIRGKIFPWSSSSRSQGDYVHKGLALYFREFMLQGEYRLRFDAWSRSLIGLTDDRWELIFEWVHHRLSWIGLFWGTCYGQSQCLSLWEIKIFFGKLTNFKDTEVSPIDYCKKACKLNGKI